MVEDFTESNHIAQVKIETLSCSLATKSEIQQNFHGISVNIPGKHDQILILLCKQTIAFSVSHSKQYHVSQ